MEIRCPRCLSTQRRSPHWISRHAFYRCGRCRALIQIDQATALLARKLDDLERALRKLFGDIAKD